MEAVLQKFAEQLPCPGEESYSRTEADQIKHAI